MRENRTSGSVRGVPGNRHSYRGGPEGNMNKPIRFAIINGILATILGSVIVAFYQGLHSHLPLSHFTFYSAAILAFFFLLSRSILRIKSKFRRSFCVWSAFTASVIVFYNASDYLRFHSWVRFNGITHIELSNMEYFNYYVSFFIQICSFCSPFFYLSILLCDHFDKKEVTFPHR
jgi:hypothetical protein